DRGGHTLLWDAGDAEDRILLESDVTKGTAIMAMMNVIGYDAAALGNAAAVTYGPHNLARLAEAANFPILVANLSWTETGQLVQGGVPYQLLELGGIKLGIIGLTAVFDIYSIFGARTFKPAPIVTELVQHLRNQGANVIAVLSHLGLEGDRDLAEAVSGLHLIVGGHSHDTLEEPLMVNDTLIAQAGAYGSHLGRIDLELDSSSGRVQSRTDQEYLDGLDDAPAEEVEAIEEQIIDSATAALTIAELKAEIETLKRLETMAYRVRQSGTDRKWEELATIIQDDEQMVDGHGRRRKFVIFTEHRDTLTYLWERISTLFGRDDVLVSIHGSIPREKRRATEDRFRNDPDVYFLLATDAAGEGINLQRAHLMINYDLPWNPNRL
ncbi:MAG: hypothetical protein KAW49_06405, partial [Anaerolineae bacterium]|nr:hypothetical protein [Anaerolineae bacterium]